MPVSITKKVTEADTIVSANIRRIRMARGVSQESMGDALGITFQQFQKYEKGANRVSAGKLALIARTLKCEVAELFDGCDAGASAPLPVQSPKAAKVAAICDRLPEPYRDALVNVANALAA